MTDIAEANDLLLERFGQLVFQFLEASCEVWSTDTVLAEWKATFDANNAEPAKAKEFTQRLFTQFVAEFKPLYPKLNAKDMSVFDEPLELFVKANVAQKMKAADEGTRDTVWEYIKQIVQSATIGDVYSSCPDEMIKRVAGMADKIVKQIETGAFDISQLNPAEISKQMMEGIDPAQIEEWGKSLMNSGNIDSIMGMMSGLMGQGASTPFGGQMPALNPAMIASVMQGMQGLNPAMLQDLPELEPFKSKKKDGRK